MKIGICGTQSVGKSTTAFQLCLNYKKQNPTKTVGLFLENVVHCPLDINKVATKESELWMFTKQIEEEIYLSTKYDILICDRTVLDTIPYTQYLGFDALSDGMIKIANEYITTYDTIIFKCITLNDYLFNDGLRDTDTKYRNDIEILFFKLFKEQFDIDIPYEYSIKTPQTFQTPIKTNHFNLVLQ